MAHFSKDETESLSETYGGLVLLGGRLPELLELLFAVLDFDVQVLGERDRLVVEQKAHDDQLDDAPAAEHGAAERVVSRADRHFVGAKASEFFNLQTFWRGSD